MHKCACVCMQALEEFREQTASDVRPLELTFFLKIDFIDLELT